MEEYADVVLLRTGQLEFRLQGLEIRVEADEGLNLLLRGLLRLGWATGTEEGLVVDDQPTVAMSDLKIRETIERLKASGSRAVTKRVVRRVLVAPWADTLEPGPVAVPRRTRKFSKEVAEKAIPAKPTARKERSSKGATGPAAIDDATLFTDPVEQLRYEVKHAYLLGVPVSQRDQWPLNESYVLMDSFMADVAAQEGAISRQQIVAAVVDLVCTRINAMNSRKPRPLREGGGEDGRPIVTRGDGAQAWRANISSGTPAARRFMWWRTPAGVVELARLATHDDTTMPER